MSKFDSWVLDQQEKEQEELAERLKRKENLRSFKVTERYIKQDTWIVNAINKEEATDIAMSVEPDSSRVVRLEELKTLIGGGLGSLEEEVECTTTEPLTETEKYLNDPLDKEVS